MRKPDIQKVVCAQAFELFEPAMEESAVPDKRGTMAWTDERVERLKKLWTDGLSASQIAADLGGVTRNAVIGKVHRLGLSGRGKTSSTVTRSRPARNPASNRPKRSETGGTVGNTALKMEPDQAPLPEVSPRNARYDELVIPISERANIMQLNEIHMPVANWGPSGQRLSLLRTQGGRWNALLCIPSQNRLSTNG